MTRKVYKYEKFMLIMEIYLVDLIKYPELKDSELEELLDDNPESLIRIPDIEATLVIGRSKDADICLKSKSEVAKQPLKKIYCDISEKLLEFVSRFHCVLNIQENRAYVRNAQSKNGTYVNMTGADSPIRLRHGDRLILRPYVFKVLFPEKYRTIEGNSATVDFPTRPKSVKEIEQEDTVEYKPEDNK